VRLENVLALTHGSLMSQPQISEFSDVVVDLGKVRHGSLFLAMNPHDISQAQAKGAYGIVYDREMPIDDIEIAWIHVSDIFDALKRIIRFMLIDKELQAVVGEAISVHIAKHIATASQQLLVLEGKLHENISKLLQAPQQALVLFERGSIDEDLFTNVIFLDDAASLEKVSIYEQTLFECAFVYEHTYYERQYLSPLFLPYLIALLQLLTERDIAFRLRSFAAFEHLQPIFVGTSLHIKEFGSSERVVIFEPDITLAASEIDFINTQAPWAQKLFCVPQNASIDLPFSNTLLRYETTQDIINALKNHSFHFAFVAGCSADILQNVASHPVQQSLF
jgi:hypothetical protein